MRPTLILSSLLFAGACIPDTGVEAPYFAELNVPDEVSLAWSEDYNGIDDGYGTLMLLDFLVYDANTSYPMEGIQVEVLSNWYGAYVIPQGAVQVVDYPVNPDDSPPDSCSPSSADWDPNTCPWYDTDGQQYFEFGNGFGSDYRPNYLVGATDSHGLLRTYVYVDSLPTESSDATSFTEISVWASIGHVSDTVLVTTSSGSGG